MLDTVDTDTARKTFLNEVLAQSERAIIAGSSLPVDKAALTKLSADLAPEVSSQLIGPDLKTDQQKWVDDSRNVILAATMLGVVATCVARLNRKDAVDEASLRVAFALVKEECRGKFGPQGCWCGCP